jgi:D-glycero-D-manno-heptose 1,7-bisphosphate phosphatase
MGKAAFLDRDGVINRDTAYIADWKEFEFLPGAIEGMRLLQDAGYELIVVTNQSGIARGIFSESDYQTLTAKMKATLAEHGVFLTEVYFCPHHPTKGQGSYLMTCDCRKPSPGMLKEAMADHSIDPAGSLMIGDKASDMEAGRRAGVASLYRVRSHYDDVDDSDVLSVSSLLEASELELVRQG